MKMFLAGKSAFTVLAMMCSVHTFTYAKEKPDTTIHLLGGPMQAAGLHICQVINVSNSPITVHLELRGNDNSSCYGPVLFGYTRNDLVLNTGDVGRLQRDTEMAGYCVVEYFGQPYDVRGTYCANHSDYPNNGGTNGCTPLEPLPDLLPAATWPVINVDTLP